MRLRYRLLNVFAHESDPFSGNPLCVFEDGSGLSDDQMQGLARQFNLSETTFLVPPEGAPAELAERVNAHRRVQLRTLRALLDWGLPRRGGPALDPDLFARSVFTLAEGAARLLLEHPERWSVEQFTDFTRTALAALRAGS